ncbi:LysR family transcriptional regulator [Comamonas sp. lk]|uniref:LysR family transcriptional regulator n=1 Tax=Comamonas sp. lk TaxID=2201272 RepID=UPI0013CE7C4F|nr:LysR family transcriptional regulator [Comamonas sp. lk]
MLDRLQTMQVFLSVAQEGGFTAAARRLSMTTPHVTRHIAALENQLGTRLLQRTTRRVSLTAAGERYAVRVREILEAVDTASAEVQSKTSALSGVLRIVAAPSLTDALVSPLAAAFREQYPGISLDVYVDAHPLPDLNRYDLGFLQVPEGYDSSIVARTLSTSEAILCASPAYIARHGLPQTPQELAQHMCVLRRPAGLHRDSFSLWRSDQKMDEPPSHDIEVQAAITINQTASILQMVLDGAGIATFTMDSARPFLNQGVLEQVLPGWITGRYCVLAALPSRKHLPERAKAFLDFVFAAHKAQLIDRC